LAIDQRANFGGEPHCIPKLSGGADVAGVTFSEVGAGGDAQGVGLLLIA
jgi:hypothetical protein